MTSSVGAALISTSTAAKALPAWSPAADYWRLDVEAPAGGGHIIPAPATRLFKVRRAGPELCIVSSSFSLLPSFFLALQYGISSIGVGPAIHTLYSFFRETRRQAKARQRNYGGRTPASRDCHAQGIPCPADLPDGLRCLRHGRLYLRCHRPPR